MSKKETLKIFERDNTITSSKLRSIGYIPATVYGKEFTPLNIQVKAHEFQLAIARGVRHFQLEGLGKTLDAQVKQLQKVNTKEEILHIEFYIPSASEGSSKEKSQKGRTKAASEATASATETPAEESPAESLVEEAVPAH